MDLYLLLLSLASAISYAIGHISTRLGLKYSNPITMTCISFATQTVALWAIIFSTGGVPNVPSLVVYLGIVVGLFMLIVRLLTYIGLAKIGAARGAALRSTYPLFSGLFAVTLLGERVNLPIALGTVLVVGGITLISWQAKDQRLPFRPWHALFPLSAAFLAGVVHPIVRYAVEISNYPLFFSALVGLVSLLAFLGYQAFPGTIYRPVWNPKALLPFFTAGLCESFGFLLFTAALTIGPVVFVAPIIATSPMWVLLGTALFMRESEQLNYRAVFGTLLVVAGTVTIIVGR